MLKTRVIPVLLMRDGALVKGVGFESWRGVGGAMQGVKVFNARDVDELDPAGHGRSVVKIISQVCPRGCPRERLTFKNIAD
jgi:hypothetical protein